MPRSNTDAGTPDRGVLTLAAVPIGRADDASARLVAELARASLIAAADTRRVRWLASSLEGDLNARVVSYHDAVGTPGSSPTRAPRGSAIPATGSSPPRPRRGCG